MKVLDFKFMQNRINFSMLNSSGRMDAEFFDNLYIKDFKFVKLGDLCEFIETGPAGSVMSAGSYVSSGIKITRPSNLDGWTCENGQYVYADRKNIVKNKIKLYRKGDILIGRIGDFKCGIITGEKRAISSNLLALRLKKGISDPYFLLAYLNSENARVQIGQIAKRVSLSSVNIHNISKLKIPVISFKHQSNLGKRVKKALKLLRDSADYYERACELFKKETCRVLINSKVKSNTHNFANIKKMKRMDAEFFVDEEFNFFINCAKVHLGEIAEITTGIEPGRSKYKKAGHVFLRGSNVSKYGLIDKSQKYLSGEIFKKLMNKFQPEVGEILFVKDGKIGTACVVTKKVSGIISSGIVRIKVKNQFDPYYISFCLNFEDTVNEIIKNSGGSLVPHLNIQYIKTIPIPLIEKKLQKAISELVKDSHTKFNKAYYILNKAVETAVKNNPSIN